MADRSTPPYERPCLIIDLWRHTVNGRRMVAVRTGIELKEALRKSGKSVSDSQQFRLYRRAVSLGSPQAFTFDHTKAEREIRVKGWALLTLSGDERG